MQHVDLNRSREFPATLRFLSIQAMMLNEFLKEHRKVEELETTLAQQQKSFESKVAKQQQQIVALVLGLQKVTAQLTTAGPSRGGLEANKLTPLIVLTDR